MPSELLAALADDVSLEMWDPLHDESATGQPPRRSLFSAKSTGARKFEGAPKRNDIQLLCSARSTHHHPTSSRTGSARSTVSFASRSPSPSAAVQKPIAVPTGAAAQLVEQSLQDVRSRLHSIVVKGSQIDKLVERSNTCDPAFLSSEEVFTAYQQLLDTDEHRMKLTAAKDKSFKDLLVECNTATSIAADDKAMHSALTSSKSFRPAMAAVTVVLILRQFESAVRKDVIAAELAERLELSHQCWQGHRASIDESCHREVTHHRRALHVAETAVTDLCHTHRVSIELLEQQHRQDVQDLTTLSNSGRAMIDHWKDHVRHERQQYDFHRDRCVVVDDERHKREMLLLRRERETVDIIGLASRERTFIETHEMFTKRHQMLDLREGSDNKASHSSETSPLNSPGWNSPGKETERHAREALSSALSSEHHEGIAGEWELEVNAIVRRLQRVASPAPSEESSSSSGGAHFDSSCDDDAENEGLSPTFATAGAAVKKLTEGSSASPQRGAEQCSPNSRATSSLTTAAPSKTKVPTNSKAITSRAAATHRTQAGTRPQGKRSEPRQTPVVAKSFTRHPQKVKAKESEHLNSPPRKEGNHSPPRKEGNHSPPRKECNQSPPRKEGSAPHCERSLLPHSKTTRRQYGVPVTTLCAPAVSTPGQGGAVLGPTINGNELEHNQDASDDGNDVFDVLKYVTLANQQEGRRRKSLGQPLTLSPSKTSSDAAEPVEAVTVTAAVVVGHSAPDANDSDDGEVSDADVLPLWRAEDVGEESLIVEVLQHIKRHRSKVSRLLRQTPETTSVHGWMLRCTGMTMSWQKKYFLLTRSGRLKYSRVSDPSLRVTGGRRSSSAMSEHSNSMSQQQQQPQSSVRWTTLLRAEDVLHVEDRVATEGGVRLPSDFCNGNCFYVDFAAHCGPRLTDVAMKRMRFCCFSKRERVEWVSALRSAAAVARQLELDGRTEPSPLAKLLSATTLRNGKVAEVESPGE